MTANEKYVNAAGDEWCCETCAEYSHLMWCDDCDEEARWHGLD